MKTILFACATLALATAAQTAAQADEVVIQRAPSAVVEPSPTVVEPSGGVVIEERRANPYDPRLEPNSQARERTPNTGDGTSSSRNANQG